MELRDHFSFRPKGFEWSPKYKSGQWDGYIRLYDGRNSTMYAGLYDLIVEWGHSRGYTVVPEYDSYFGWPKSTPDGLMHDFLEYVANLEITSGGKLITPHDYQIKSSLDALQDKRHVILLPTGAGKSLVLYLLMRYTIDRSLIEEDQHIILVVPTVNLVKQMYTDFEDYSTANGWDVSEYCQQIYAGQEKEITKKVVITTWQSLINFPFLFFKKVGSVFGDEAHHFKADSLTKIMQLCVNAPYRISMTGTLDGDKINSLVLQGLFGKIVRYASTKELQDRGILAPLKIAVLVLKYPEHIAKVYSKVKYEDEIKFITNCETRDKLVADLALGMSGNTLVMFKLVEHGKRLHEIISSKTGKRSTFLIYGGVAADDREEIRKIFESEKSAIATVSVGTFAEGVNIKNVRNLLSTAPGKSRVKVLQALGRTLRLSPDGEPSMLVDFADNFCYKGRKNHTFRHLEERLKMYDEEGFDYQIIEVNINVS